MTRDELIRRLRRLARKRGVTFEVIAARGKGGHWTVRYGEARVPVPQAKGGDIAPGTLQAILRAFGLRRGDLE
jgi:mRNA interferase HicA